MQNDNLMLWKLKYGKAFLNSYLKCGHMVFEGKKCLQAKSIKLFIGLGLFHEIPQINKSGKVNKKVKLGFTKQGISIYDQLLKQINRGIIYKEQSGTMNWKNFRFITVLNQNQ